MCSVRTSPPNAPRARGVMSQIIGLLSINSVAHARALRSNRRSASRPNCTTLLISHDGYSRRTGFKMSIAGEQSFCADPVTSCVQFKTFALGSNNRLMGAGQVVTLGADAGSARRWPSRTALSTRRIRFHTGGRRRGLIGFSGTSGRPPRAPHSEPNGETTTE